MNNWLFTFRKFIYFSLNFLRGSNKKVTMKHRLLLIFMVLIGIRAIAQQEAQYTNFMFSQMSYNPGYAGSEDQYAFTGLYRNQWMGFKSTVDGSSGAPITYFITGHTNINKIRSGIGFSLISDQIGFENNIAARLAYAFRLNVGPGKLGIGVQGGFINKKIDFSKYKPENPNDPLLASSAKETAMSLDFAFGLHYKIVNKLYAGLSSTRLTQSSNEFSVPTLGTFEQKRHYFLYGGYYYQLPNRPEIEINPNLMVKTDFASAQYDFNVLGILDDKIYAGISYRVVDAVSILAGMAIKGSVKNGDGFRFGASYDVTTSTLGYGTGRSAGSVEFWLDYSFKIVIFVPPSVHGTVRFL